VVSLVVITIESILLRCPPWAHSQVAMVGTCDFVRRPVKERVKAPGPRISSQARLRSSTRRVKIVRDIGTFFIVKFCVETEDVFHHAKKPRHQVLAFPFIFPHAQQETVIESSVGGRWMVIFDVFIVRDEEGAGGSIVGVLRATNDIVDGIRHCGQVSLIMDQTLRSHITFVPTEVVTRYSPRISSIPAHGG
jgi:hypothetical protein